MLFIWLTNSVLGYFLNFLVRIKCVLKLTISCALFKRLDRFFLSSFPPAICFFLGIKFLLIRFYRQPFISKGRYSDFNFVYNPTASSFNKRVTLYDENQISYTNNPITIDLNTDGKLDYDFPNGGYLVDHNMNWNLDYAFKKPDFSFVQLQTNLVVR